MRTPLALAAVSALILLGTLAVHADDVAAAAKAACAKCQPSWVITGYQQINKTSIPVRQQVMTCNAGASQVASCPQMNRTAATACGSGPGCGSGTGCGR